jgi:thiol-disulfide isomerase/thioredoxin
LKKTSLILALLLPLLLTSCGSAPKALAGKVVSCSQLSKVAKSSTDISLRCLDGGAGASINSLRGPMIINVWGSWCAPCKEEIPIFRSFYKKAKGSVALTGVDVEEATIKDGQSFVEKNGMTWPNLFDQDGRSRAYFGMGVPVTWFISASGVVMYKKIGAIKNEIELISLTSKYLGVKF